MDGIDPADMAVALSSIPLFREFQRVLQAGSPGAANWDIGSQLALALASAGPADEPAAEREQKAYEDACRFAELEISQKSGLDPPHQLATVSTVDRQEWARLYLPRFRPMIDRLTMALRRQIGAPFPVRGMEKMLDALGSFAMGAQVGFLVGHLSHEVISQFEIWLPAQVMNRHIFVASNARAVGEELQAAPDQFRAWLALHEVSRQMELDSVPWAKSHLLGLIGSYVDAAEIDFFATMERLQSMQDPEELNRLMEQPQNLLPLTGAGDQGRIGNEIQSLIAVLEGYGEWLMQKAAKGLLPEFDKITEGMVRRRVERSSASQMLEKLLGIALQHEHLRAGRRFVQAVAEAGKLDSLFAGPGSLPSLEDLADPGLWLKRVGFS